MDVADIRFVMQDKRLFHSFNTKVHLQCDGKLPRQNPTREPVDNSSQIYKTTPHGNVGNIHDPHLIGSGCLDDRDIYFGLQPANGYFRYNSSIRRISPRSASDTECGL